MMTRSWRATAMRLVFGAFPLLAHPITHGSEVQDASRCGEGCDVERLADLAATAPDAACLLSFADIDQLLATSEEI
ncbi:hypothetical protein ATO13_21126 [Stappia sp. 22II-S9-Z10]|nr:hypothetical protein ATO13_21126 [Stappia sp. 22II-S9-Z10]